MTHLALLVLKGLHLNLSMIAIQPQNPEAWSCCGGDMIGVPQASGEKVLDKGDAATIG